MVVFKSYKISSLFDWQNGNTDLLKEHINGKGYPVVSSGVENTGIIGYTDVDARILPAHTITVDMFGNVYYRDFEYKEVTHARVFTLIPKDFELDIETGLYFVSSLKMLSKIYSYNNMCSYAKISNMDISLPVIKNSNPDHEYTIDDINWQYMRDCITEQERDRITELDAYLQATGLNDCELTEEDKKVLSKKVNTKEFVMHDVFEKLKAPYKGSGKKQDNVSKIQTKEYNLPLINCKYNNNGIMYYGRKSDYTYYENVLSVIYNGPPTEGQTYYQEEIGVYTDAYLIALKNKDIKVNREIGLYLTAIVNASIHNEKQRKYSRGNKATWEGKVENDKIILPITSDGAPDFDYMERYIRAVEKVVIADVVKYKDKVIGTTKKVAGR